MIDIIGQKNIKEVLKIQIEACKKVNKIFPHTIFLGPSGTGKTTIARQLANTLGYRFKETNAASLKNKESVWLELVNFDRDWETFY